MSQLDIKSLSGHYRLIWGGGHIYNVFNYLHFFKFNNINRKWISASVKLAGEYSSALIYGESRG